MYHKVILKNISFIDNFPTCEGQGWLTTSDFQDVRCCDCSGTGEVYSKGVALAYHTDGDVTPLTFEEYVEWLESLNGDDDLVYLAHIYENTGHLLPNVPY